MGEEIGWGFLGQGAEEKEEKGIYSFREKPKPSPRDGIFRLTCAGSGTNISSV